MHACTPCAQRHCHLGPMQHIMGHPSGDDKRSVPTTCARMRAHAGEAQKIDRIMEKLAERYCRDNPGAFASADGAYLLAFALIMLNTDAHNPHADRKLSAQDFVAMCQAQV